MSPEEQIQSLKDKIADCREYISSDFCTKCIDVYKEIESYQNQIKILESQIKQ